MKLRNKKGFTIIELVIVIAVIGVLTAVLVPTFTNLLSKANKASDDSLVSALNKALQAEEAYEGKKNDTYYDAMLDLEKNGFILPNLQTKSGEVLLWDKANNKFLYESELPTQNNNLNYWKIQNDLSEQKYSVYAGNNFAESAIEHLKVGFDAGRKNIPSIHYEGNGSAQEVVIRTNGGELTVNAPNDTIAWFGSAKIDIEAVDKAHSFHAYGRPIGEVKIKSGHYFVESTYESNFLVLGDEVTIDTQTKEDVIVLKDSSVSSYTVNGVVYSNSAVVSGETQEAAIDETKAILNANTKVAYNTLQEAIDAANYGDKLVLLKDLVIEDNSPTPTKDNNNAAITIRDKAFSLNGNGNTITSDGKHSGSYTSHDLFNLECSGSIAKTITMNIYSLNIEATHYQDVFLINSDVNYDFVLNLSDSSVTCDGECIYSNGPRAIAVLNNCEFIHEGVYAEGKDDRYYSALIVGYGGFINAYNCKVNSFGNGVTTFPSGGVVNLFNTDINIEAVTGSESSGYAIRCTMEPNSYEGLYVIRGAEISVYGGTIHGDFSLKDTSVAYDAKISLYEGIFDHNPSAYVVDGKTCTHSGDKWIVK